MEKKETRKSFIGDIIVLDKVINFLGWIGFGSLGAFLLLSVSLGNILLAYLIKDISLSLSRILATFTIYFWEFLLLIISIMVALFVVKYILSSIERRKLFRIKSKENATKFVQEIIKKERLKKK